MLEMSKGHTRSRSWKNGVDVVLEWNRVVLVANILDHENPLLRQEDDSSRKLYWYNNPIDQSFIPSGNPSVTQGPPASSR